MIKARREQIGAVRGLMTRIRVYRIPDGLEVDDVDHYEVTRRRVFFDDIVMVSYHRFRGFFYLFFTGLFAVLSGLGMFALMMSEGFLVSLFVAPIFLLFAGAFAARLFLAIDVIVVWGKRSRAEMHFAFRKRRARQLYSEIVNDVRRAHRRRAAEVAVRSEELPSPFAPPGDSAGRPG